MHSLTPDNRMIHILQDLDQHIRTRLHPKLSVLRHGRDRLLSSAALQWVLRATAEYSICTVCSCNALEQRYQIQ